MISLSEIVRRYGPRALFIGDSGSVTYAEFAQLVEEAASRLEADIQPDSRLALSLDWSAGAFARLLAALRKAAILFPGSSFPAGDLAPFLAERPLLILRTGGTTGRSRHVVHSARRLLSGYRLEERPERRLLVLYEADHIAGLDAFFQALHRGASLVIPKERTAASVVASLERQAVNVLPATPTYLQFLILSEELKGRNLSSVDTIPHGAEPMPEVLRARVQAAFPSAKLVQRFGMTELGALPVTADPEDPAALFLDPSGGSWKVEAGELFIRCPTRMLGTLEDGPVGHSLDWHRTGDLAEETPRGSVKILGRAESLVNVGGLKVIPEVVEALLMEQAGVRDAAVSGIPNPLTGQAVMAQIVHEGQPDLVALLKAVRVAAREQGLSLAHVPTRIVLVDHLHKTAIGKRSRSPGKA